MFKRKAFLFELLLLFIITTPAFYSLLNGQYFSMHDDQHIVRLYLLDQAIKQGDLFPRWVGGLGFGFGYPLFNFYPPLIYYIGEAFHLLGFSFIWSIKLTFIAGFYLGAIGIYFFTKKITNRLSAFLASTLFTFFFYHAVLIYVRGALAEFYGLTLLPFVFWSFYNLATKLTLRNSLIFGVCIAFLILAHPLVAFPAVFLIAIWFVFFLVTLKNKVRLIIFSAIGGLSGILLSAFFWLPSFVERKYTLTDQILTSELASYKLHYVLPQQFIYSPWGYGGSGPGLADGMTFQLGKIHIGLVVVSVLFALIYCISRKKTDSLLRIYLLLFISLVFSLFMTTESSSFIWDSIQFLSYLQFPWRFMTFTTVFIAILGGYSLFFLSQLLPSSINNRRFVQLVGGITIMILTGMVYGKYFKPEKSIMTSDSQRTAQEEIEWRISSTSYEFVPKGVRTKKSSLDTTLLAIDRNDLPTQPYEVVSGVANVSVDNDEYSNKIFTVNASSPTVFKLNTYNFPGWTAYLDNEKMIISDNNDLKLITVVIPPGQHVLSFRFEDTKIRSVANTISFGSLLLVMGLLFLQFKKVNS